MWSFLLVLPFIFYDFFQNLLTIHFIMPPNDSPSNELSEIKVLLKSLLKQIVQLFGNFLLKETSGTEIETRSNQSLSLDVSVSGRIMSPQLTFRIRIKLCFVLRIAVVAQTLLLENFSCMIQSPGTSGYGLQPRWFEHSFGTHIYNELVLQDCR